MHKLYFKYFVPHLLNNLVLTSFIVFDGIFLGQMLGVDGLSAARVCAPIFSIFGAFGLIFGLGGASISSYYLGKSKPECARKIFSSVFWFLWVLSLGIGIFGFTFTEEIAIILGSPIELIPMVVEFCKPLFLGTILIIMPSVLGTFVANDNRPGFASFGMISGTLINIFLSWIFVCVLNLGMLGSALGTLFGSLVSLVILLTHFTQHRGQFYPLFVASPRLIFKSFKNGLGPGMSRIGGGLVMIITIKVLENPVDIALYSILTYLGGIAISVLRATANCIQPIVAYNCGSKNYKIVNRVFWFSMGVSIGAGLLLYLGALCAHNYIPMIFLNEESRDALVDSFAPMALYLSGYIFTAMVLPVACYLQNTQNAKHSFWLNTTQSCAFTLVGLLVFPEFFGVWGVWMSLPFGQFCSWILGVWLFKLKNLKSN